MKRWLSLAHFHLVFFLFIVSAVPTVGAAQQKPILEQSFQIVPDGVVEVDNSTGGGVQIQTWDENYVHIKAEKVNPPGQPVYFSEVSFAASESTIVVGCHPTDPNVRINLTVFAPRQCQVQMGKGQRQARTTRPAPTSQQGAGNSSAPTQTAPPAGYGSSGRIAGDTGKGYDQSNTGRGPMRKTGDTKTTGEGSMGVGVRVIPPLGTTPDDPTTRRRSTSGRDPFSVFDQDPFFDDDRNSHRKPKPSDDGDTDGGRPDSSRDNSSRRQPEPVLRSKGDGDRESADSASKESNSNQTTGDDNTLVLDGELVNLHVSVRDRAGKAIGGLVQANFQVYEDDVQQPLSFFSPTSAPFNLVLVLDLSGSMREKIDVLKGAAIRFIDTLNPQDRVAVVAFTHQAKLISSLTTDRTLLRERIREMEIDRGRTALYEAMWQTLTEVLQGTNDQRNAIVVLTDGVDNSISEFNTVPSVVGFDELLNRVEESDVIIYPIYLDTEQEVVYKHLQESPEAYRVARGRLQTMADVTGGLMFSADRLEDLDKTYQQVAADLRTVYTLAYYPTNGRKDSSWRHVKVKLKGKNGAVRTRSGYYAR